MYRRRRPASYIAIRLSVAAVLGLSVVMPAALADSVLTASTAPRFLRGISPPAAGRDPGRAIPGATNSGSPVIADPLSPFADLPDIGKSCLEFGHAELPKPAVSPYKQSDHNGKRGDHDPWTYSGDANVSVT
jgi:hypothetical protein